MQIRRHFIIEYKNRIGGKIHTNRGIRRVLFQWNLAHCLNNSNLPVIKPSTHTHSVHSHTVLPSQPHKNISYFSLENGSEFANGKSYFSSKKLISVLLIKRGPPTPCLKDYIADRHDDRRSGYFCLTVQNDKKNALCPRPTPGPPLYAVRRNSDNILCANFAHF